MKLSVVIPTYRRAESLNACLKGLRAQLRAADEVIVVTREGDDETAALLANCKDWAALKVIRSSGAGAVSQYNAGLDASQGDVVAVTDDDAVPRPEWLQRIERHFLENSDLGGLGGRDFVQENGVLLTGRAQFVGIVQWFGRVVGNHHIGTRFYPSIDILKGANMAFRATAISDVRFDPQLRGSGAQVCLDMAFSFCVRKAGWRILFDPEVAVDHYPARRFDPNQRQTPSMQAIEDNSFNFYLTLRRHMWRGWRRRMALWWAWSVGIERSPGFVRGLLSSVRGDRAGVEMRAAARRAWISAKQLDGR